MAECADAVFLDVWLREYSSDRKGMSVILVLSQALEKLLDSGISSYSIFLQLSMLRRYCTARRVVLNISDSIYFTA